MNAGPTNTRQRVTVRIDVLPGAAAELVAVRLLDGYEEWRLLGAEIKEVVIEIPSIS